MFEKFEMLNGRGQPRPYFLITKWLFFVTSSVIVLVPSFLIPRNLCQLPWALEPLKLPTKLFCVMGVVKRHTCVLEIINFENLFQSQFQFFFVNLHFRKFPAILYWTTSKLYVQQGVIGLMKFIIFLKQIQHCYDCTSCAYSLLSPETLKTQKH